MPSVIDVVDDDEVDTLEAGAVLAIEHHRSTARGLWPLGHGGSLYLIALDDDDVWLVAVLEAPEQSQVKRGDRRPRGWYAAPNDTPITRIPFAIATRRLPRKLTDAEETRLRELVDASDAPVVEAAHEPATPLAIEGPPLQRAASYLATDAVGEAIGSLLEAWRSSRAVELADLIDRASRVHPSFDRPLSADKIDDASLNRAWSSTFAADPVGALPQLLRSLSLGGRGRYQEHWEQVAGLPDDPRISRFLLEGLFRADDWLTIVERGRDARSWEQLVQLASEVMIIERGDDEYSYVETPLSEHAALDFARVPPKTTPLKASERAPIATIEAELDRLEAPARTARDLVDQIAEHWDDDGPRLVYADWLIERGHPRGEYVSLVLAGDHRLSPAKRRRLAQLTDVPFLFGVLDEVAVMKRRTRDRGLDRTLDLYWSTTPWRWAALAREPLVRVLRSIRLVGETRDNRAAAIAGFVEAAPRLDTIEGIDARAARSLLPTLTGWKHTRGGLVRGASKPARRR